MMNWIFENWHYILLGLSTLSLIFSIILMLIKKVPLSKILKVISLVPDLIQQAELLFPMSDYGRSKKQIVIDLYDDICVKYGIEKYKKYIDINSLIEDVLNCPQKK